MPIGIQRLNARKSQPNAQLVFIKPLKSPDEKVAQDFLERIAAQCFPVMKENHISVMSLEEYEPNPEFVGRNFNAGEVIQLVLKSRNGRWLPFDYVQMVMMHELAHCKQMNHSKAFWAVRNQYATRMRELWQKGYTGEGIWGRGAQLGTGAWETNTVKTEDLPEHLCGGTYRSRSRKRKAKPTLTYKERKEQRILKKFGANGVALGADEGVKAELECGKKVQAKPRVAGSARGRELRAAAALARFDQAKPEPAAALGGKVKKEEDKDSDDDGDGGESEYEDESPTTPDAIDINGSRIIDGNGRGMVKVCGDAQEDDDSRRELLELQASIKSEVKEEDDDIRLIPEMGKQDDQAPKPAPSKSTSKGKSKPPTNPIKPQSASTRGCRLCSFENSQLAVVCSMCANVLDANSAAGSWPCHNKSCADAGYLNSGDCGICGLCGQRNKQSVDKGMN